MKFSFSKSPTSYTRKTLGKYNITIINHKIFVSYFFYYIDYKYIIFILFKITN